MTIRHVACAILALLLFAPVQAGNSPASGDFVVDFTMAERTVNWLEFIGTGADSEAVYRYFVDSIGTTAGCDAIIAHWSRFMEWDLNAFYLFAMKALGRVPTDDSLVNDDGTPTRLGARRAMWTSALNNPDAMRRSIREMKAMHLDVEARALALKFLPGQAIIDNSFYFLLFGGSSAFSVGKVNGFDLLQLPKLKDGSIHIDAVMRTLAHEMHHTGLTSCDTMDAPSSVLLAGLLTAEGMPTHFINHTRSRIDELLASPDPTELEVAADWQRHLGRLPELYREAERDLRQSLAGEIDAKEVFGRWMDGTQGPAYVLGADMMAVIEEHLGADAAIELAGDYRKLLLTYNRAAEIGNRNGGDRYVFAADLARNVATAR